ncbi:hypothetical protein GCM10007989_20440 [Devosia pacifica]|uniref:Uncharacterized protein n=1 Tax=Devosia pacifica TaxID=1335967 RepID=A0A918VUM5_9HYPH|nr:hypothetical protein [Devosia pacifica]GHA24689.1 hypothetical protein GCM10007989_20440 [Devosia pacifica]
MPHPRTLVGKLLLGAGLAGLLATPVLALGTENPAAPRTSPAAILLAQADATVDFGDDTGAWSNDGECDDPRFEGEGVAEILLEADLGHDATDCRTLYESGAIQLVDAAQETQDAEEETPPPPPPADDEDNAVTPPPPPPADDEPVAPRRPDPTGIDFGDDSGDWPNDGECDDPRFTGAGMALFPTDQGIGTDASDCRTLFEAGKVRLTGSEQLPETPAQRPADIDFGDDDGNWANDGECDDPRFEGQGMAVELVEADRMHDATDCRTLYEAGSISLVDEASDIAGGNSSDIDFGNDTSIWARDGECDDPRFTGSGMAADPVAEDMMSDATDCEAAYSAGTITLIEAGDMSLFDFGDDSSEWSNDGECDDPRFTGPGMAKKPLNDDTMSDATDCEALADAGEVEIKPVFNPAYVAGAPYDSSGIDFGDNTSTYADDDICDDPRFEGPGAASILLDSDELRDAADCRMLYEAGRIVLLES